MIIGDFLCSKVVSEDNESINVPSISRKRNRSGYLSWSEKAENGLIGVDTATFVSVLMKKEIPFWLGFPLKRCLFGEMILNTLGELAR
ncbi:hypothetical protein K3392_15440 [Escherichia coli]|nr:hypothetical protein K3392_15440 [Escherichia coli]